MAECRHYGYCSYANSLISCDGSGRVEVSVRFYDIDTMCLNCEGRNVECPHFEPMPVVAAPRAHALGKLVRRIREALGVEL